MRNNISSGNSRQSEFIPTVYVAVGVTVIIILMVALLIGVLWLAQNYPTQIESVRDIFIIALALESCLGGIVLILMLIMLIRLFNTLEFEIKPILEQTNETLGTVRGTSTFVSKNVVQPVVVTRSYFAGIRRGFQALFGNPRKNLPD
jgi:hypothetical protein